MADAGTIVNALTGYPNAYTGAIDPFSGSNDLSPQSKVYYDTMLLENAREEDVISPLLERQPLPAHQGTTIEWRRWNTLPDAEVLQEGVIPSGKKFGQSKVVTEVVQRGLYVTMSDKIKLHGVDDILAGAVEELGAAGGRSMMKVARAALQQATNVMYADAVNLDTGAYVSTPASRLALSDARATFCALTPDMAAKVRRLLMNNKAKPWADGYFRALIHPSVAYHFRQHKDWKEPNTYVDVDNRLNGEIGALEGIRFVESINAPVVGGADLSAAARNLKVGTAGVSANATVPVAEAITAAEAAALAGRQVLVGGVKYTVESAAAGLAGAASIKLTAAITAAANTVVYPGEGGAEGKMIYQTIFLGRGAAAVVDPEGAGMETIVQPADKIGGPLKQFSTAGIKFECAAKIFYPERVVLVESMTAYSTVDKPN